MLSQTEAEVGSKYPGSYYLVKRDFPFLRPVALDGKKSAWSLTDLWFLGQTNDLQLVRDALRSLRNSFSGHDPQHHTIDSLEQGISSLMERLYHMETQERQERTVKASQGTWLLTSASHTQPRSKLQ